MKKQNKNYHAHISIININLGLQIGKSAQVIVLLIPNDLLLDTMMSAWHAMSRSGLLYPAPLEHNTQAAIRPRHCYAAHTPELRAKRH